MALVTAQVEIQLLNPVSEHSGQLSLPGFTISL